MKNRADKAAAAQRRAFEQELLYGEARITVAGILRSLGLTQRQLASRLGLTEGRVSQILSGRENITLRTLADLGWALGLRFELQPSAMLNRQGTPAEDDPAPPQWIGRLKEQPRVRYADIRGPVPARKVTRDPQVFVTADGEPRSAREAA